MNIKVVNVFAVNLVRILASKSNNKLRKIQNPDISVPLKPLRGYNYDKRLPFL